MAKKPLENKPLVKCICTEACQVRHWATDRIHFFDVDDEFAFPECPPHFLPIANVAVDFATATESLLLQSTAWKTGDAIDFLQSIGIQYNGREMTKKEWVELIIDSRDRYVNLPHIPSPSV